MRIAPIGLVHAAALLLLASCSSDSVLFVTATSIGIDADTATQSASIGYDRTEGVIAPVYDDGQAPPVYARLQSDLSVFSPQIAQVYATGDAALIAVRRVAAPATYDSTKPAQNDPRLPDYNPAPQELAIGEGRVKRVMVFGTGTHWGLEATYRSQALASLSLGYKRAETSYIPLMKQGENDAADFYASVLAAINLDAQTSSFKDAGLNTSSFFATGDAAKQVAARPDIYTAFQQEAQNAIQVECDELDATDKTDDRIRAWLTDRALTDDQANQRRDQLRDSMKNMRLGDLLFTSFLGCGDYKKQRMLAIKDNNIP